MEYGILARLVLFQIGSGIMTTRRFSRKIFSRDAQALSVIIIASGRSVKYVLFERRGKSSLGKSIA